MDGSYVRLTGSAPPAQRMTTAADHFVVDRGNGSHYNILKEDIHAVAKANKCCYQSLYATYSNRQSRFPFSRDTSQKQPPLQKAMEQIISEIDPKEYIVFEQALLLKKQGIVSATTEVGYCCVTIAVNYDNGTKAEILGNLSPRVDFSGVIPQIAASLQSTEQTSAANVDNANSLEELSARNVTPYSDYLILDGDGEIIKHFIPLKGIIAVVESDDSGLIVKYLPIAYAGQILKLPFIEEPAMQKAMKAIIDALDPEKYKVLRIFGIPIAIFKGDGVSSLNKRALGRHPADCFTVGIVYDDKTRIELPCSWGVFPHIQKLLLEPQSTTETSDSVIS
jgi:hypothetical protein